VRRTQTGLPTVSVRVAVAGGFPMPALPARKRMAFERWADTLYRV